MYDWVASGSSAYFTAIAAARNGAVWCHNSRVERRRAARSCVAGLKGLYAAWMVSGMYIMVYCVVYKYTVDV